LLLDGYILHVAIEHRLMHLETLAYMLHRLPLEQKAAPAPLPFDTGNAEVQHAMMQIRAGTATLGLRHAAGPFGWDNEFEEHAVEVPAFTISKYKTTNGQFREFVNAGGYREGSFWKDSDWQWKEEAGIRHPQFWIPVGGEWKIRTMFAEIPLPLDWPAYVSHAEAAAYARWASGTLPTEAQFHRAAYGTPSGAERQYPWGSEQPTPRHGNFDFARWDPAPVNAFPAGDSAFGVADLLGNGWEWTATVFAPFAGFEPFPFYRGYSADFFDGKHHVMKGGSPRTASCMLRRSFRNWFQGHYPHVYAGFRIVQGGA
jgi:ergothioneine biosynthesis protein EgtB